MNDKDTTVLFGDDARTAIMVGVNLVCDATSTTLGPLGMNAAIDKGYKHEVIHDGVNTAISVNPKDPYAKLGAKIIKEAAKKQRDEVGDGTTAVMVLTQAILKEALKATSSGVNAMTLRKGLESGSKKVIEELKKLTKPITTLEQKINIATISAEDKELGEVIAKTIHEIGAEGIMTVEESKLPETIVERQEGMQIDKGYAHPWMITDPERKTASLDDVAVLVTDYPLTDMREIGTFLNEKVVGEGKTTKLVFISPEISGDFLSSLVVSKAQGTFLGLAVKCPFVGSQQAEFMQDLCALLGAKLVSKEAGHKFSEIDLSWLGKVERIVSSAVSTIFTNGGGSRKAVLQRIQIIKKHLEDKTITEFEKANLQERLGKLTNGIAVVKVGGETEIEMNERKERAIDAVAATQAAVKYGIVQGGETVYLTARESLDQSNLGEKILYDALSQPFKKLVSNAGYDSGEKLAELKSQKTLFGFDVTDGTFKDMIKSGIIDPLLVPETAVKTAVSVATQIMTIGAVIVPEENDKKVS